MTQPVPFIRSSAGRTSLRDPRKAGIRRCLTSNSLFVIIESGCARRWMWKTMFLGCGQGFGRCPRCFGGSGSVGAGAAGCRGPNAVERPQWLSGIQRTGGNTGFGPDEVAAAIGREDLETGAGIPGAGTVTMSVSCWMSMSCSLWHGRPMSTMRRPTGWFAENHGMGWANLSADAIGFCAAGDAAGGW